MKENIDNREKTSLIISRLEAIFPNAQSELKNWTTPFQFLVCIILSAQATDKGVNKVTGLLFEKYPTPQSMASADLEDIKNIIKSINFFNNKAKHILKTAQIISEKFNGEVPKTEEELVTLSGVGRKTAHVFLNDLYHQNDGIAVDTHVGRVARRLGLTKNTDPNKIAEDLEKIFDREDWYKVNSLLVLYGRYICTARNPKCEECQFKEWCEEC